MRSTIARTSAATTFLVFTALAIVPATVRAHDGHDHGAPPPPVSATIAPRADASSADFELVAIARGETLTIHLDTFKGSEPIGGAEIEVDTPAGVLKAHAAAEPGLYTLAAPLLTKPGAYDLAITIISGGTIDVLTTTLNIPEPVKPAEQTRSWLSGTALAQRFGGRPSASPSAATPIAARDVAQRFADGALFVPKATQRILALRTAFTELQSHRHSIELPGRVVPDPNASGLVQAAVGGRLAPPAGGFKTLGTPVKSGDILAYVQPPLPSADATSQQQQARELEQQISIVARKVERFRSIERVIARSQLEDAELELKGLNERRANLARANRTPEALVAPVDGVIASANAVAGQFVEPNTIVFQIVDPKRLWIEALTFEPQATNSAAQGVLADGRTVPLAYLGTGLADRNQAVPVHFAVEGETKGLRSGQFVSVLASTQEEQRGIALPREAVLRGTNGQSIVFEHTNAERFVIREVRVEPLDGARVLVLAGIAAGKRVVTQGAELLNQIR